ncbi:MAG: recombinase family protein [Flavobacteriaceae bacterium]|nr:recombinase family protein [Flavobacteriaceae bacterium]
MLGIYTRLSKEDEESNSISNQSREGFSFATKNNFDYKVYDEGEGISGTLDIENRPVLTNLITDVNNGTIKQIWMRNQNRLDRNSLTFFIFIDAVKKNNVDVYFGDNDKLDFNDPATLLQSSILSSLNAYQAGLQSKATKKALKDNAKEGKTHGINPYGYTKDSNSYIIIEGEEAEVVKRIFKMSLEGKGTNKIAEIFNSEGIPTRYNKIGKGTLTTKNFGKVKITKKKDIKWSGNTIRSVIKNTIYKGERHLKSGVYKAPNIVEPHYWQRVNDNLKNNANNSGKVVNHKYMLKGIMTCGICGRNYYGRTRVNKKDNYYMCSSKRYKTENCGNRSININVLENFIWQRFFVDKELLKITEAYFKDTDSESKLTQIRADIKLINKELIENDRMRKKARKLALLSDVDDDEFASEIKQLKINKNDLDIKLRRLLDDENYYINIDLNKEKEVKDLNEIYTEVLFNQKREVIQKYIKDIIVYYKNGLYALKFRYKFNITPEVDDEAYLIDRNYNVMFELCKKYILPLSDKAKKMSEKELIAYADNLWNDFDKAIDY